MAEPARKVAKTQQNPPGAGDAGPEAAQKSVVREYGEALIIAFILAIIIRTFFVQAYKIPSGSMEPTLLIGDHILVDKFAYGLRLPDSFFGLKIPGIPWGEYLFDTGPIHRGDVIVFVYPCNPSKDFIKRVIGVPGDTVEIKAGHLILNGAPVPDPHAHFSIPQQDRSPAPDLPEMAAMPPSCGSPFPDLAERRDYFGPMKVPPGKYFMMGDNRDLSYDSRFWGFVPFANVEGRAFVIYWSWNGDGSGLFHIRWSRFGNVIH